MSGCTVDVALAGTSTVVGGAGVGGRPVGVFGPAIVGGAGGKSFVSLTPQAASIASASTTTLSRISWLFAREMRLIGNSLIVTNLRRIRIIDDLWPRPGSRLAHILLNNVPCEIDAGHDTASITKRKEEDTCERQPRSES